MKHLQTYELTRQEHAALKTQPFLLKIGPSPVEQHITLMVESSRRNGHSVNSPAISTGVACDECGATQTVTGKPFTNQTIAAHKFKAHGTRGKSSRRRKGGAK